MARDKGRQKPGSTTGAVNGARLGEGADSIVNVQQRRGWGGWGGQYGCSDGDHVLVRMAAHTHVPCPLLLRILLSVIAAPVTIAAFTCCLADRKPDWHYIIYHIWVVLLFEKLSNIFVL